MPRGRWALLAISPARVKARRGMKTSASWNDCVFTATLVQKRVPLTLSQPSHCERVTFLFVPLCSDQVCTSVSVYQPACVSLNLVWWVQLTAAPLLFPAAPVVCVCPCPCECVCLRCRGAVLPNRSRPARRHKAHLDAKMEKKSKLSEKTWASVWVYSQCVDVTFQDKSTAH